MGADDLAVMCKADRKHIKALWLAVYKLIVLWARRYCKGHDNRYSLDDLTQSAYFALLKAVDDYRPESGYKFTTFLYYHCKNEFSAVLGIRTSRREPPLLSIDAPVSADENLSLSDTVPDERAAAEMEKVVEDVYNSELRCVLDKALGTIPELNRLTIEARYYNGLNTTQTAAQLGLKDAEAARRLEHSALRALRRGKAYVLLKSFDYRSHGLKRTSMSYFRHNMESGTEAAALKKLERERRYSKLIERIEQIERVERTKLIEQLRAAGIEIF